MDEGGLEVDEGGLEVEEGGLEVEEGGLEWRVGGFSKSLERRSGGAEPVGVWSATHEV